MSTNDYNPLTALTAYYVSREERRMARLWATEKLLHDLKAVGMIDFFEGAGTNPTLLDGYSAGKAWLQVSAGITQAPGVVRAYAGSGDPSLIGSWPAMTSEALSGLVQFRQSGSGAVERSVLSKLRDIINVRDFGARFDNGTDDTAAIQAAINAADSENADVILPAGTAWVSGLEWKSGVNIRGAGKFASILKLIEDSNTHVIAGTNADALFGTDTNAGIEGGGLYDLCIDGNMTNQSAGCGLAFYGQQMNIERIRINNCKDHAWRSEWYTYGEEAMESLFKDVQIDTCGKHGFWFKGPHDSVGINITVVDAGQETDDTYDGILVQSPGNGRWIQLHAWHRSTATNRMRWSTNLDGSNEVFGGHFEGGRKLLRMFGNNNALSSCAAYGCFGSDPQVVLKGSHNSVDLRISELYGVAEPILLQLGEAGSGNELYNSQINIVMATAADVAIGFVNEDSNDISVRLAGATGAGFQGTPGLNTAFDIQQRYPSIIQASRRMGRQRILTTSHNSFDALSLESYVDTPANGDSVYATFKMRNNNSELVEVAQIAAALTDVSDGSEDAELVFSQILAGALAARLRLGSGALYPHTTDGLSLGYSGGRFSKAWLSALNVTHATPASAGASGTQGDIAFDADYIYICTATNTWKRVAIATWP